MPGPSSSTMSSTWCPATRTVTAIASSACRAALSTRFRTTWASDVRSPRTRPAPTPEVCTTSPDRATRLASASARSSRSTSCVGARDHAFIRPGEQQQLLDQPLHARRLLQHGIGELALRQRAGMCASHLGRLADAGEGRTQLVRGVGDELLLPVAGVLETTQHLVHGLRQSMDLVAGAGLGHPPVQPVTGDLLDLAPDPLDGASARVATTHVVPPTSRRISGSPPSSGATSAAVESSTSSSESRRRRRTLGHPPGRRRSQRRRGGRHPEAGPGPHPRRAGPR